MGRATHALTAQKLIHAVLKTTPRTKLQSVPRLNELFDALIPYTRRHFERLDRLMQQSRFLAYTVQQMKTVNGEQPRSADAGEEKADLDDKEAIFRSFGI